MDIARLIQQKIPIGSHACFTLKNGEKKTGILTEISKNHVTLEKNGGASKNLIDFTYPYDLFKIVFAEWDIFKQIFEKDKQYWEERARLISKIRNPLAHNRDETLTDYERQIAEGYCKEILNLLSAT